MILRCTRKLLAVIDPDRTADRSAVPQGTDWYANLLWCERRKCFLLTHAATLFTAVQANISTSELRSTLVLVRSLIERELASEGLPPDTFGDLNGETLHLATTADRSVLGCMNDMAIQWQAAVANRGGLANTDPAQLNRALRRNINSTREYQRPLDLTTKLLARRP